MASIKPRLWTNPDGTVSKRWVLNYVDDKGKRRRPQFKKKSEANDERVRVEGAIADGIYVADRKGLTVKHACTVWLSWFGELVRGGHREQATLDSYTQHVNFHIAPHDIAEVRLGQLTGADVDRFARDIELALSPMLARKVLSSLRAALERAKAKGWLKTNPALGVRILTSTARDDDEVQIPSLPAMRAILEASRLEGAQTEVMCSTLLFTGLRISEWRGLGWSNVTLTGDNPQIRVVQKADKYNRIGKVKTKAARRRIPIGPKVLLVLRNWRLACSDSELVFPRADGGVMAHSTVWRCIWAPVLVAAQAILENDPDWDGTERLYAPVPDKRARGGRRPKPLFGLHALRHGAASLFIDQGLSPKQLKERMGHEKIEHTYNIYGHLFADPEGDQTSAEAIEARVLG